MIIKKSRINSVDKYFANIAEDKEVYVSVPADENNIDLLKMDGCLDGTCVVPQPIGPVTRFNLYGKELIHKEMEKEHREIERIIILLIGMVQIIMERAFKKECVIRKSTFFHLCLELFVIVENCARNC